MQCWKSRSRDSFGVERVSRGCINENDRISLMCKTTSHTSSKQKRNLSAVDYEYSAAYAMNCCSDSDFCNDGEFPELPHVNDLGMILIFKVHGFLDSF